MQFVHKLVDNRRDKNRDGAKKDNAAKKCVKGGKKFAPDCFHRIYRTHPGQDHGSIQQGIDPRQLGKVMIANDSDYQRGGNDDRSIQEAPCYPAQIGLLDYFIFLFVFLRFHAMIIRINIEEQIRKIFTLCQDLTQA